MKLKDTINKYPQLSIKQLIDRVKGFDIVFFDIFDTLLKRDVAKEHDVFDFVERNYNLCHKDKVVNFRKKRIEAEMNARKNTSSEEVTLKDIYAELSELDEAFESKMDTLMCLEEEMEYRLSCPNPLIKQLYQYCLNRNKKIYIISDMYLSKDLIVKMLSQNGYTRYEKLYLSSEIGLQKRTGNLFKHVMTRENIKKGKAVHIGDNKKSDWIAARDAGFATVNIAKYLETVKYRGAKEGLDSGALCSFINNRIPLIENRNVAIGYEVYGPVLYSFVSWLKQKIDSSNSVLFFARDCFAVKKAYEIVTDNNNSIYFYGSRKSLLIPALYIDSSIDNLCRLVKSESSQFTVSGLLRKIGLDPVYFQNELKNNSLSLDTVLVRDQLKENNDFVNFYYSIQEIIKGNAEKAYIGFSKYFDSLKCTHDIQVVDIGWRCTMQYCLKNLLIGKHNIQGLYLGEVQMALREMLAQRSLEEIMAQCSE